MDCSQPGSPVHEIFHVLFQARVLEWGAIAFSDKSQQHPVIPKNKRGVYGVPK